MLRGYRRVLVPVVAGPESARALDLACRLAADSGASLVAVAVIEVPPLLPLDAHMIEEEADARALLERAGATADSYGIALVPRLLRSRTAGDAIVELARAERAELVVIGGTRRRMAGAGAALFGGTVKRVLEAAPCRVMVVTPQDGPAVAGNAEASA